MGGMRFASRPCRQRFYRHTIQNARSGNAAALAIIGEQGWNISANIGGGRRIQVNVPQAGAPASTTMRRTNRVARSVIPTVQRIGVEIEFVGDAQRVMAAGVALGLDIRVESYSHTTRTWWKIVPDGSCGLELVSPPLAGSEGFEQIRKACGALRDGGARVNVNCGLHVHLEAQGITVTDVKRLVKNYTNNQGAVDQILSRSRRGNRFCAAWTAMELTGIEACDTMEQVQRAVPNRYKTLNLQCFPRYGTIEFRQHQGTHNAEKIIKWIAFCEAMLNAARTGRDIPAQGTIANLIETLSLTNEDRAYFTERAMELA